jgi:hypothetical protein
MEFFGEFKFSERSCSSLQGLRNCLAMTDDPNVRCRRHSPMASLRDRAHRIRVGDSALDIVFHTATLHKPHVATHTRQQFIDTNVTGTSAPVQSCYQVATPIPSLSMLFIGSLLTKHRGHLLPSRATSRATNFERSGLGLCVSRTDFSDNEPGAK